MKEDVWSYSSYDTKNKTKSNKCTVARMLVNKKKLFKNRIFVRIPGHF